METYKITYFYKHPTCGFSNEITVQATTPADALSSATKQVLEYYDYCSKRRFSFSTPQLIIINHVG